MACTHLFLGILVVPLMGLDGALGPCPTPCRCSLEILNCSRITNPPGFHQVPLPNLAVPPHPFIYLDFTGNAISSVGKEVWKAYPWTEYLVLKDNSLSKLQNSSLEGLLSLTYLDLSYNKIQIIERNAFEAVPFLQIINLRGNVIEQITEGTFRAWHGMQFLLKVDLSHNPLAVIQDSYFYRLPLLKLLDLGATKVTPRILEDLLQTSLQLRTLILPKKMSCCLCHIKDDIEGLCDTVKLECTGSCDINATVCKKEEPLNRMEEEVMKILEIRKWNGSSLLSILPERAISHHDTPERPKPDNDILALVENYSSLTANMNLLKSVKRLMQMEADEPLDINWADKSELEKLYLLASLLQAALKQKIVELDKVNPKVTVQNELSNQVLVKPTNKVRRLAVTRENSIGRNQRQKDTLFRLGRDGQQVAKTATQSADKPRVFELHNKAESWRKVMERLDPKRALLFLRSRQVALQPSWKRSISDSPTNALKPTDSIVVDNDDNDLTGPSSGGNSLLVLRKVLGTHILTKEELLNPLLHRSDHLEGDGKPEISASDSEPSFNDLSPVVMLSHGTYWEHQKTSVSPPLGFLARHDDNLIQGELFETELNKKLSSLIPNTPVRKLLSHVIRILKMDCTTPVLQMACAKLITRTDLLMKLLSENNNENASLWKSYFWPPMNMTKASSEKLEKPSGRLTSQGIPVHQYGDKLFWVISGTTIILIIFSVISLIMLWSRLCAAKDRTFLGRRKKPLPDEELPRTPSLSMDNEPVWFKEIYHIQDETQRSNMVDKFHDEESFQEMDMDGWDKERQSLPEPTTEEPSSASMEKSSDTAASSAAGGEGGDEDPTTTDVTSEVPESGEGDEEGEGEGEGEDEESE
ncbi:UNVERIFIED_CONTAM: hypothetical protein K2H54_033259 [Gekko kuhli]